VALRAIRAPPSVVLKVPARRPRTLFQHVVRYELLSRLSGARAERGLGLGPWGEREFVVVARIRCAVSRKGHGVRLVVDADSMTG
jgi:hypothetical protein